MRQVHTQALLPSRGTTLTPAVIVLALCWCTIPNAQDTSQAIAEQDDFGKVRQGESVYHEFRVANPRTTPLRVLRVDVTAPGMSARFKPDVAAGEAATIKITWNTSKVQGATTGKAIVHWADPTIPSVTLAMKGVVQPPIELLPMAAAFFSLFQDETAERVIQIVNHETRPLRIDRLEPEGSHFAAKIQEIEPGRKFELHVAVPKGTATGRFMEGVTLHTDAPNQGPIRVPVNVFVKADVYANPEEVDFGEIDLAALKRNPARLPLLTQTFLVKRRQGPFDIKTYSTDVQGVVIKASPGRADAIHQFTVSISPDKLSVGPLEGHIRIQTSDSRFAEIVIPVHGRVR